LTELFEDRIFYFPKSVKLISLLVKQFSHDDGIVLDFFSGSGTTAHAVMQVNAEDGGSRTHIQVQLPEPTEIESEAYRAGYKTIADIAIERINRAGGKIKTDFADQIKGREKQLDVGLKVFKLSDSNFTKWRTSSDTDNVKLQQHLLDIRESSNDAATEEDLLVEILLKQGISLTAKISHESISDLSIWNVGETTVLAYLDEHVKPDLNQLREITSKEPAKFIIIEDAFHGDDELKTNLAQICKTRKIELWTV
jgi:adenine-specific DNA-methyltransferase